jgi:archaetidylinositol phosphate synthase
MHPWRDRLARWFTPLARRCPLSPNAITAIALLLNIGAATSFYLGGERPILFMAGIALLTAGGLADAFDGIVARVQGKSSRYGDFVDHFADRVSDLLVVAGWMLGNRVRPELVVLGLLAVMLNGYAGTQIEATWHERNYESVGRGEFVLGLIVFPIVSFVLADNGWSDVRLAQLAIAEWLTLLLVAFAALGIGQRLALASRMERSR